MRAEELFYTWSTLTRMYTTISPHEMLVDPTFVENREAPSESVLSHIGVSGSWCDGVQMYRLPDARVVAIADGTWPGFPRMPPHERIEQWGPAGAPMVIEDRYDEIDGFLADWNAFNGGIRMPPSAASWCGDESGDGGGWDSLGFDAVDVGPRESSEGCGCRTSGPSAVFAFGLGLLVALGRRRRR
jgi:MYXO-CTERM domain-containing protein